MRMCLQELEVVTTSQKEMSLKKVHQVIKKVNSADENTLEEEDALGEGNVMEEEDAGKEEDIVEEEDCMEEEDASEEEDAVEEEKS